LKHVKLKKNLIFSTGSGSLAASGSVAGSSSFLVGRQRERLAEMELFRYDNFFLASQTG
jgi:hypothetical protein